MESTSSFGYWIRRQRKALDLTQQTLADKVGCSLAAIKKIEGDERRPSRQIAERLADILGVPAGQREIFLEVARGVRPVDQLSLAHKPAAPSRPSGTVTFLYTDIEGSTKLAWHYQNVWDVLRKRHHAILRANIEMHRGYIFQVIGDAFCAAFHTAEDALHVAVKSQIDLHNENWGDQPIKVRMGIHTGKAEVQEDDQYHGYISLSYVQRLMSAGHGGQVLISFATQQLIQGGLPEGVELRDLGEHRLKDFDRAEHIFQIVAPGLPADFPPLMALATIQNNLPAQLTSFVGREREITEVKQLLSNARLLTLTGPGGTGKTRLSIQVANELLDQYPAGVWMVELAPILDPLRIPRTTAIAIGLRDEPHRPVIDMLCDYLREKKMLLILDNCEHLVDVCARMVDTLLHACPQIHILATSREALGIAGETSYLVPSLALPDIQNFPPVESLSQYEAIRLFIDRATSAFPTFTLTDENASSIAQICHHLDGIPLAIELAAGKIRALSTGQIAQRLDDRFHLLTGGNRTALPRHQTLQAAIEWSYNLLSHAEQILFRRLSVFVGGWTLEAAESVCSNQDTNTNGTLKAEDILEFLIQLINKSLITTDERNGEARYHMLETIRQYAHEELLKSGEANMVRIRHLDFFMKLAEAAEPNLLGIDPAIWLNRLEEEHDNMRAALKWSLAQKERAEIGLRLALALSEFWDVRGYDTEGRIWLEEALKQTNDLPTRARAMAFLYLTDFSSNFGATAESEAFAIQSITIFRQLGAEGQRGLGTCLRRLGIIAIDRNDFRKAQTHLTEALKHLRESGDQDQIARTLTTMGYISRVQGNYRLAQFQIEEGLKLAQGKTAILGCLRNLGTVLHFQGAYQRAQEVLEQGLRIAQELGSKPRIALMLTSMGDLQRARENYKEAAQFYHQALNLVQEVGGFSDSPTWFSKLGYVELIQGNEFEAASLFAQSLRQFQNMRDRIGLATALVGIAGVASARKDFVKETHLLSVVAACLEAIGAVLEPPERAAYDRLIAAARSALNDQEFEQAWAEGQAMTMEEAIVLATENESEDLHPPKA